MNTRLTSESSIYKQNGVKNGVKIVTCLCGFSIFYENILRSRVLRFEGERAIAKCKRCKREVVIPFIRLI